MTTAQIFDLWVSARIDWYSYSFKLAKYQSALSGTELDREENNFERKRDIYIVIKRKTRAMSYAVEGCLQCLLEKYSEDKEAQNIVRNALDRWHGLEMDERICKVSTLH